MQPVFAHISRRTVYHFFLEKKVKVRKQNIKNELVCIL